MGGVVGVGGLVDQPKGSFDQRAPSRKRTEIPPGRILESFDQNSWGLLRQILCEWSEVRKNLYRQ